MAQDRIILRGMARELTQEEVETVSGGLQTLPGDTGGDGGGGGGGDWGGGGGDWGGGWGDWGGGGWGSTGLTGGQTTQKVSSKDPNGPMDEDRSVADF